MIRFFCTFTQKSICSFSATNCIENIHIIPTEAKQAFVSKNKLIHLKVHVLNNVFDDSITFMSCFAVMQCTQRCNLMNSFLSFSFKNLTLLFFGFPGVFSPGGFVIFTLSSLFHTLNPVQPGFLLMVYI